jgi:tripartite-type tricarboxylate transporter receptor subunit TctC
MKAGDMWWSRLRRAAVRLASKESRRSAHLAVAALAAAVLAGPVPAQAPQPFPSRRVTLVVPNAPGAGLDAVARLIARRMAEEWGQPVVVENISGADSLIGTQRVAAAAPDGYTMLLQIPALLLLKHNTRDAGLDPAAAFMPVSELGRAASAISVNSKLPIHTVADLAAYCGKASPPCTWGSGQQLSYLYGKRLFTVIGIKEATNVPYKGTAPVITDLLGGHITIGITSAAAPFQHHKTGALRILAINAERRDAQLPDVPTYREAGIQLPARGSWYGLFVPKKTPFEIVAKIEKAVMSLAADSAARSLMQGIGAEAVFGSQQSFATAVQEEEIFLDMLVRQYPLK